METTCTVDKVFFSNILECLDDSTIYNIAFKVFGKRFETFKAAINTVSPYRILYYEKLNNETEVLAYIHNNNCTIVSNNRLALPADCEGMFYELKNIGTFDMTELDTSKMEHAENLFRVSDITEVILENNDLSNVISFRNAFADCKYTETIRLPKQKMTKLKVLFGIFSGCTRLKEMDIDWDTPSLEAISEMFRDCLMIKSIKLNLDTRLVQEFNSIFFNCTHLENLDIKSFDTSNATSVNSMFAHCNRLKKLDVSHFNTHKVLNFNHVFLGMKHIEYIDLSSWDLSSALYVGYMFHDCENLREVKFMPNMHVSAHCEYADHMFFNCSSLEKINLSWLDMVDVGGECVVYNLLVNCSELEILVMLNSKALENIDYSNFEDCPKLKDVAFVTYDNIKEYKMYSDKELVDMYGDIITRQNPNCIIHTISLDEYNRKYAVLFK